jgi:hypothetical protein
MLKHIDDVQIPEYLLPALINGDTSDLSGTEENDLEVFLLDYQDYEGLIFDYKGEPYFAWSNPVNGLGCTVIDVSIYGHAIERANHV